MSVEKEDRKEGAVLIVGWSLVLLGWVYSVLVANGSELQRLAFVLPFVCLGAFFCVLGGRVPSKWPIVVVTLATGYFLWRASTSPVWDEARRDVMLVTTAYAGFIAAAFALDSRACRGLLVATGISLLCGHLAAAGYQYFFDMGFKFLRPHLERERFISGLVFNRNYFSGLLAITTPIFVALAFLTRGAKRLFYGVGVFVAILLAFVSVSRGGFGTVAIGAIVTGVVVLWRFWRERENVSRFKAKGLIVGGVLMMALSFGLFRLWSRILDFRNGELNSGLMEELQGRQVLSGVAFDIWQSAPLLGTGAETFSFLFTKYYSSELHGGFVGYARMVHNDYMQVLTDYGLIGFVFLILLIVSFGFFTSKQIMGNSGDWRGPAFAGALVSELLRATIDFNLHLAPSLLIFAILAGGVTEADSSSRKGSIVLRVLALAMVLSVSAFGLGSFKGELRGGAHYAKYELAKGRGDKEEAKAEQEALLEIAPEFRMLRAKARDSMLAVAENPGDRRLAILSQRDWERVVQRHPFDGESLANLARAFDEQEEFERAVSYHRRAIEAAGNRERKYGVFFGFALHLVRQAELLRKQRRPGEALFLLKEARELVRYTQSQNFENIEASRTVKRRLDGEISFLVGARIEEVQIPVMDWRAMTK